jgi:hypothetical protein
MTVARCLNAFCRVASSVASERNNAGCVPEDKERALAAAGESYCKTAVELGYTESQAQAQRKRIFIETLCSNCGKLEL